MKQEVSEKKWVSRTLSLRFFTPFFLFCFEVPPAPSKQPPVNREKCKRANQPVSRRLNYFSSAYSVPPCFKGFSQAGRSSSVFQRFCCPTHLPNVLTHLP